MGHNGPHCCEPGGSGGSGGGRAGLALSVVIAAALASAYHAAIGHAVHVITDLILVTVASLAGLALAALAAFVAVRVRRASRARGGLRPGRAAPAVSEPERAWHAEVIAVNGRALPRAQRAAQPRTGRPERVQRPGSRMR